MLKPTDPPMAPGDPDDQRPVGELVHQLVEDGKAYARAELGVATATAKAKADALKVPAILFAAAFLLVQAALAALAVAVALALEPLVGILLGGLLAFLLFAGLAGGLGWLAVKRLKEGL